MLQQWQGLTQPQFKVEGGRLVMFHTEPTGLPNEKDPTVNDRDRMQDILAQEKYLTNAYSTALSEVSHDALHRVVKENFDCCREAQRAVFNVMFKLGWYKLPVADAQSVSHAYEQFKQYQSQFPFPWKAQDYAMAQAQAQAQQGQATTAQMRGH